MSLNRSLEEVHLSLMKVGETINPFIKIGGCGKTGSNMHRKGNKEEKDLRTGFEQER